MTQSISLRRPLHLKVADIIRSIRFAAPEVAILEQAAGVGDHVSKHLVEMLPGLDRLNDELIDLWLEAHDPTCDPQGDIRPVFDRIEECNAEWEAMKGVLAALGTPESQFPAHQATFTVAFWRGTECAR